LVALDGNLRCLVDPYNGTVYNIPNYCITDPTYKKNYNKENLNKEEKKINLELIYVFKNISHHIKVSNKINGFDLKNYFCKLENINIDEYRIRLLTKGQEIKNDIELILLNVDEGDKIQVSCFKIEE